MDTQKYLDLCEQYSKQEILAYPVEHRADIMMLSVTIMTMTIMRGLSGHPRLTDALQFTASLSAAIDGFVKEHNP